MRKIVATLFFVTFLFSAAIPFSRPSVALTLTQEKIIYDLPYPGILPDHPLYFLKVIRDRALELGTRDPMKKAELYFLLSDKRVSMAIELAEKRKDTLAVSTLSKGEKYFLKIPDLIVTSQKQGVGPATGFIDKLKQSNMKHREVAETLLKELPDGQAAAMNEIINMNSEIRRKLNDLQ